MFTINTLHTIVSCYLHTYTYEHHTHSHSWARYTCSHSHALPLFFFKEKYEVFETDQQHLWGQTERCYGKTKMEDTWLYSLHAQGLIKSVKHVYIQRYLFNSSILYNDVDGEYACFQTQKWKFTFFDIWIQIQAKPNVRVGMLSNYKELKYSQRKSEGCFTTSSVSG